MSQSDLQEVLTRVDRAAVLVSPRIIERVIRDDCALPNMYWNIPHAKTWVCDRQLLFRHAEPADLDLDPDQIPPDTVVLLVRPDPDELSGLETANLRLKYWRRLFHARIHQALGVPRPGRLSDEDVRDRIAEIGPTEFEEVRRVLVEDNYLPDHPDDRAVYVEFASVYLEMRHFSAGLLANYFPGIRDFTRIEAVLSRDIDAQALFKATRLEGAADPIVPRVTRSEESQETYWKLVRAAQSATEVNNTVRAAILRMKASRIAPAAQTLPTRKEAEDDVRRLCDRLSAAFPMTDDTRAQWVRFLTMLLERADQGTNPMEAQVLMDLQKVCLDREKDVYTLDVLEYVTSLGKRSVMRPLPSQRFVRIAAHLRAAQAKLGGVRLADGDRAKLSELIDQGLHHNDNELKKKFEPILRAALADVGMRPETALQHVAFDKMVAELLDRINAVGFLSFAELRDTISRNEFKLADLREPDDFVGGDALLRMDRRLAAQLDGVYRPSELYVRWLERFTSIKFGTAAGRALTLWLTLPFLTAYLTLHMIGIGLEMTVGKLHRPGIDAAVYVLLGPVGSESKKEARAAAKKLAEERASSPDAADAPPPELPPEVHEEELPSVWWHVAAVGVAGLFGVALIQSRRFRRRCARLLGSAGRLSWWLFIDVPRKFLPVEFLKSLVASWWFQVLYWYVLKPAAVTAVLYAVWPLSRSPATAGLLFLFVALVVNSRVGRRASEAVRDAFAGALSLLNARLFRGLVAFTIHLFKRASEFVEYLLFVVDEWLRFRRGDGSVSLAVRAVLGVLWAPVAFFIRLFTMVMIEPWINPLKLPITLIAGKVMIPVLGVPGLVPAWQQAIIDVLANVMYYRLAELLVIGVAYASPAAVAFLIWEMKENWSLYRANRSRYIRPAYIGSHGESVRGLLQPGFHSGRVPQVFAKLRAAERQAHQTRDFNAPRLFKAELDEVAHAFGRLVERELLSCLLHSRAWAGVAVRTGPVHLSTNRIVFELDHDDHPARPVEITLEHHDGTILAAVTDAAWLEDLPDGQLAPFAACLGFFYKRADIDVVREQLERRLGLRGSRLQVRGNVLTARSDGQVRLFDLRDIGDDPAKTRLLDEIVFGRLDLRWEDWSKAWKRDAAGEPFDPPATVADVLPARAERPEIRPDREPDSAAMPESVEPAV